MHGIRDSIKSTWILYDLIKDINRVIVRIIMRKMTNKQKNWTCAERLIFNQFDRLHGVHFIALRQHHTDSGHTVKNSCFRELNRSAKKKENFTFTAYQSNIIIKY